MKGDEVLLEQMSKETLGNSQAHVCQKERGKEVDEGAVAKSIYN